MMKINKSMLAKMIDHTLLKATATEGEIVKLCAEADKYGFASVCVNPWFVPLAYRHLKQTEVKVCTVVGFPLGATTTATKVHEAVEAVKNGAHEIDMVINLGMLKSGCREQVLDDIKAVVDATSQQNPAVIVKVIIETCYLNREEKILACQLALKAGAHFVKTSTGFGTAGAVVEDVKLMRETVGTQMGVKAAGGIKTAEDALKLINAGANRLGASAGVKIINGFQE